MGVTITVRTAAASLVAGTVLGAVLMATGRFDSLVEVYGLSGVDEWHLLYLHSAVATAGFVAVVSRLARSRFAPLPLRDAVRYSFPGACIGLAYGTVLWLVVVAYGVPLWFDIVGGQRVPMPYHHLPSLDALVAFGTVLGASYPIVRRLTDWG
ncbi:hypothetical protein [Halovalidus salilacus]|uniref:hypothetical protein n=1 Tax=Halovalidus salilacus TaxID=3075124 RepID=UPI00387DD04E